MSAFHNVCRRACSDSLFCHVSSSTSSSSTLTTGLLPMMKALDPTCSRSLLLASKIGMSPAAVVGRASCGSAGGVFRRSRPLFIAKSIYHRIHPKHRIWGWFRAPRGASNFKWHWRIPYQRPPEGASGRAASGVEENGEQTSLQEHQDDQQISRYHYPEVSKTTGEQIDWYNSEPKSGLEFRDVYGENTIELSNLPMGVTPENLQERLRRFFSKFGGLKQVRCLPHSHDPYQCSGTGYVTFETRRAVWDALHSPLKLPASLCAKTVHMKSLDNDKQNDPIWIKKREHFNDQLLSLAEQLHTACEARHSGAFSSTSSTASSSSSAAPLAVDSIAVELKLLEQSRKPAGHENVTTSIADEAVYHRFGSWERFLTFREFAELFLVFQLDASEMRGENRESLALSSPTVNHESGMSFQRRCLAGIGSATGLFSSSCSPEHQPSAPSVSSLREKNENGWQLHHSEVANTSSPETARRSSGAEVQDGRWYVSAKMLTAEQRVSVLTRAKFSLHKMLEEELSVYWRKGKMELPEYTKKVNAIWHHKPVLPWRLQRQSWPTDKGAPFHELAIVRQQLKVARNEKRQLKRAPRIAKEREEKRKLREQKDLEKEAWNEKQREKRTQQLRMASSQLGLLANTSTFKPLTDDNQKVLHLLQTGKIKDGDVFDAAKTNLRNF
ncbi:unnamed protein product [Amoebophrya sp. A120]|nr:unnamed protein product [Amoebophrya sp. A120]|eukprot:GSA120T00002111001.1